MGFHPLNFDIEYDDLWVEHNVVAVPCGMNTRYMGFLSPAASSSTFRSSRAIYSPWTLARIQSRGFRVVS